MSDSSAGGGLGVGAIIAGIISFVAWKSIGWAILHILLGWIYVVYYLITYGFNFPPLGG